MDNLQFSSLWLNLFGFDFTKNEKMSAIDIHRGKKGIKLTTFLNRIKINKIRHSTDSIEKHTALLNHGIR